MNLDLSKIVSFSDFFNNCPERLLLAAAIFVYNIPIFVIHKLDVRHLEKLDDDFKFIFMKQVYNLEFLDEEVKGYLEDLFNNAPSDPIFTAFGKRMSIANLTEFERYVQNIPRPK